MTSRDLSLSRADKVLDLDLLLIQLHDTSEEWRSLGAALGISPHRLDDVGNQCGAPDQCLVEVLDVWLREHQSRPTWGEVAEALDRIGWSRLAEGIKRVYTTGGGRGACGSGRVHVWECVGVMLGRVCDGGPVCIQYMCTYDTLLE